MKKNIILLILLLNITGLIASCFNSCDQFKYFTYEGIKIHLEQSFVENEDSLLIEVNYLEPDFTAQLSRDFLNQNTLNAFDCDKGWGGDKFPLTRIAIKSDSDFNSQFLAGEDLSEIIKVRGYNDNNEYIYDYLDNFNPTNVNTGYMYILLRPEIEKEHIITIEFEKDNGEIVTAISDKITWE